MPRGGNVQQRMAAAKEKRKQERIALDVERAARKAEKEEERKKKEEETGVRTLSPGAKNKAILDMKKNVNKILPPARTRSVLNDACCSANAREALLSLNPLLAQRLPGTHPSTFSTFIDPSDGVIKMSKASTWVCNTVKELNRDSKNRNSEILGHTRLYNSMILHWLSALIAEATIAAATGAEINDANGEPESIPFQILLNKAISGMKGRLTGDDIGGPLVPKIHFDPLKTTKPGEEQVRPTDAPFKTVNKVPGEDWYGDVERKDGTGYVVHLKVIDLQSLLPGLWETTDVVEASFLALEEELEQALKNEDPKESTCTRTSVGIVPMTIQGIMAQTLRDIEQQGGAMNLEQSHIIKEFAAHMGTPFRASCRQLVAPRLLQTKHHYILLIANRLNTTISIYDGYRYKGYHEASDDDELTLEIRGLAKSLERAYPDTVGKWTKDVQGNEKTKWQYVDMRRDIALQVDGNSCAPAIFLCYEIKTDRPQAIRPDARRLNVAGRFDLVRKRQFFVIDAHKSELTNHQKSVNHAFQLRREAQQWGEIVLQLSVSRHLTPHNLDLMHQQENAQGMYEMKKNGAIRAYRGLNLNNPFEVQQPQLAQVPIGTKDHIPSSSSSKLSPPTPPSMPPSASPPPAPQNEKDFYGSTLIFPNKTALVPQIVEMDASDMVNVQQQQVKPPPQQLVILPPPPQQGPSAKSPIGITEEDIRRMIRGIISEMPPKLISPIADPSPTPQSVRSPKNKTPNTDEMLAEMKTPMLSPIAASGVHHTLATTNDDSSLGGNLSSFNGEAGEEDDDDPDWVTQMNESVDDGPSADGTKSAEKAPGPKATSTPNPKPTLTKELSKGAQKVLFPEKVQDVQTSSIELSSDDEVEPPPSVINYRTMTLAQIFALDDEHDLEVVGECNYEDGSVWSILVGDVKSFRDGAWMGNFFLNALLRNEQLACPNNTAMKAILFLRVEDVKALVDNKGSMKPSKFFKKVMEARVRKTVLKMRSEGRPLVVPYHKKESHWCGAFCRLNGFRIDLCDPYKDVKDKIVSEDDIKFLKIVKKMLTSVLQVDPGTWERGMGSDWPKKLTYFKYPQIPIQKDNHRCGLLFILNVEILNNRVPSNEDKENLKALDNAGKTAAVKLIKHNAAMYFRTRLWTATSRVLGDVASRPRRRTL